MSQKKSIKSIEINVSEVLEGKKLYTNMGEPLEMTPMIQ